MTAVTAVTAVTQASLALADVTATTASASRNAADACEPARAVAPLATEDAAQAAHVLKAVAEPLRLRMLSYLTQTGRTEACVCDLAALADVSQPTVSHHLKVLREAGILTSERRGTWVWYAIAPAYVASVDALLDTFLATLPVPATTALGDLNDH